MSNNDKIEDHSEQEVVISSTRLTAQLVTSVSIMALIGWPLLGWPYISLLLRYSGCFDFMGSHEDIIEGTKNIYVTCQLSALFSAPFIGIFADKYGTTVTASVGWLFTFIYLSIVILAASFDVRSVLPWMAGFIFLGISMPFQLLSHQNTSRKLQTQKMRIMMGNLTLSMGGGCIIVNLLAWKLYKWLHYPNLALYMLGWSSLYAFLCLCFTLSFCGSGIHEPAKQIPILEVVKQPFRIFGRYPVEMTLIIFVMYVPAVASKGYYLMTVLDRTSQNFTVNLGYATGAICLVAGFFGSAIGALYAPFGLITMKLLMAAMMAFSIYSFQFDYNESQIPVAWWVGGVFQAITMPFIPSLRVSYAFWKTQHKQDLAMMNGLSALSAGLFSSLLYIPSNYPETMPMFDTLFIYIVPLVQFLGGVALMTWEVRIFLTERQMEAHSVSLIISMEQLDESIDCL